MKDIIVALVLLTGQPTQTAYGCGMAPLPPLGCTPTCQCDASGRTCRWVFTCG